MPTPALDYPPNIPMINIIFFFNGFFYVNHINLNCCIRQSSSLFLGCRLPHFCQHGALLLLRPAHLQGAGLQVQAEYPSSRAARYQSSPPTRVRVTVTQCSHNHLSRDIKFWLAMDILWSIFFFKGDVISLGVSVISHFQNGL